MEIYEGHNAVMRKSLDQFGKFDISQDEFLLHFGNEKVNPSWVHLFSKGLAEINTYCSFAFRKHWIKKNLLLNHLISSLKLMLIAHFLRVMC